MAEDSDSGRKLRAKERKKYIDQEIDEDDIDGRRMYSVEEKLLSEKFNADMVQELKGPEFTMEWMQRNGLTRPIVFYDKTGLGLRVPSENFKVSDVKQCVGSRRILDVMDVTTQKAMEMSMKDWVKYYENPERDRLLNVISLEFCHTRLENYVESPTLVRQVDWVDRAWPRHLKECQTESTNVIEKMKYPKVQKYCLMSVAGCYTDFHIDFGGTSVWYHILHGEKIFWLAPPSQKNIDRYTEWTLSAKQGDTFLGDTLEQCQRINLCAGSTFIIPSGWIHAVYTPKDSLVFGGNFLHSFNIENQLLVSRVEDKTYVPSKFRYPFFSEIMWYVVDRYLSCLTGRSYLSTCEKDELDEDDQGLIQVDEDSRPPSRNPDSRPPSRAMDDSMDAKQIKSESGEDAPKLSKSVTIELTRIDQALRRSQSEDENQPPLAKPRVPRKAVSDSNSSWEGGGGTRKWIHLTPTELRGLHQLVDYLTGLMALPPNKRGVPREMLDPEAVLREIRQVLEDHKNDDPELAVTGEPDIGWPESAKKKQQKLKLGYKTFKTAKAAKGSTGSSSSSIRRRRTRCKQCEACTRTECGECTFCKDMKKFGGPGRMKQTCISRQCMAPVLPSSSVCMICNQEGQPNPDDSDDVAHSLMECGICWEIVHPACLQKKYENLDNDGVVNEDLPNSWECSKCCNEGKQGQLKPRVRPGVSSKKLKLEDHRFSPESDGALEEDPISPISPVEGKRVVSKEGGRPKNGVSDEPFIKTELGAPKWPSPPKKMTTPPDVKVKSEDGPPSPLKSMPSSQSREDSQKKRNTPQLPLKDQKKQIKKEKISAPNSPSSLDNKHTRKRPVSNPGSSGEKTTASPQLTDSGGKRPKRESDTAGGQCDRINFILDANNSKALGLNTERRPGGASKRNRSSALTLQGTTSEVSRSGQVTGAKGKPLNLTRRSTLATPKHSTTVGDLTNSLQKPKRPLSREIREDRVVEFNSNRRDEECNSNNNPSVHGDNVKSSGFKSINSSLHGVSDGKKIKAVSTMARGLNSAHEKLTNIFDISFTPTTSSPSSVCSGSKTSLLDMTTQSVTATSKPVTTTQSVTAASHHVTTTQYVTTAPQPVTTIQSVTADSHPVTTTQSVTASFQPVTTTIPPVTKISDTLLKKPQDVSFHNAKFIVVTAKSPQPPTPRPHQSPTPRSPQSPDSISSLPLVPSWFQPRLVSSSVNLCPTIPRTATVISPDVVFKKPQILNGVHHPVPSDHPYSKEPSVA